MTLSLAINQTMKWLSSLPILMQESFWWWQCSDRYIISLSPLSPSLINLIVVSVDVKHHVYLLLLFDRDHLISHTSRPVKPKVNADVYRMDDE